MSSAAQYPERLNAGIDRVLDNILDELEQPMGGDGGATTATAEYGENRVKAKHDETTGGVMVDVERYIAEAVAEAIDAQRPFESRLYNNYQVTAAAIRATEGRLRSFPETCRQAKEAAGADVVALNHEIRWVKGALEIISKDPYYRIIPDFFFNGHSKRDIARGICCDLSTIHRNKRRLLEKMAIYLYGVDAWTM